MKSPIIRYLNEVENSGALPRGLGLLKRKDSVAEIKL